MKISYNPNNIQDPKTLRAHKRAKGWTDLVDTHVDFMKTMDNEVFDGNPQKGTVIMDEFGQNGIGGIKDAFLKYDDKTGEVDQFKAKILAHKGYNTAVLNATVSKGFEGKGFFGTGKGQDFKEYKIKQPGHLAEKIRIYQDGNIKYSGYPQGATYY